MNLNLDIERQIAQYNYDNAVLARKKPTSRFVIGSVLLHILSASTVVMLGQPPQPKPQEIVEIDFSSTPIAPSASAPQEAPVIQEAAPAAVAEQSPVQNPTPVAAEATPEPSPIVIPKSEPKPAPVAAAKPKAKKSAPTSQKEIPPVATVAPAQSLNTVAETQPEDSTPATLDDIETPTLDDSEVVAAIQEKPQTQVSKEEVDKKLEEAEKAQAEKSALLAQQMEQEAQSTEEALNGHMNEAESAVAEENAALASQAQARADALKAAQASKAAQTSAENGSGQAAQEAGPGSIGALRTLDQLRQMPGNPKPQYTPEERYQGQQGAVIFKAFVTKEGQLTGFELLQSTGHRNLDFKTLRALKQWKFYPGQQGWVELPFKWDLKGGPQEMPTLLRRRVSQQN